MDRFKFFVILCILITTTRSYSHNDTIFVSGLLYSSKDSVTISDVHILNLSTNYGQTSDLDGRYIIKINKGDTIQFSAIGYKTFKTDFQGYISKSKKLMLNIFLKPITYELKPVTIFPYQNYSDFKNAFLNLKFPENKILINLNLPEVTLLSPDPNDQLNQFGSTAGGCGISINGPFTYLYDRFSKQGREKIKYESLIKKKKHNDYIASKYNEEIVKRVTKINDPELLRLFMKYCNLSDWFVKNSNDYDIIAAIIVCYDEFSKN